jgi:23S rRNA pseudouridine1911/1915/1917 synthase
VRFTVTGDAQRLDRFLVAHWSGDAPIGRRGIGALLAAGCVRVNGRRARKATLVRAGDEIVVALPSAEPRADDPQALPVIHESADLVGVDKPPGMPTTEGPSGLPSVAGLLLARFPEMTAIDARRGAGLAHRLDTGTSGLLLAARTLDAYARLRQAFREKRVEKHYLAVVLGRLETSRTIAQPLRRHRRSRRRMVGAREAQAGSWPAITDVRPLLRSADLTLVHLRMRTGVTHQLRVHLASIGHPVLGDRRYGEPRRRDDARLGAEPAWHFLHAAVVRMDLPGLPARLATDAPSHWRPLCTRLGWTPRIEEIMDLDR